MKKEVSKTNTGVNINFTGSQAKKQNVVSMVENCKTGSCTCMPKTTKEKIKNMKVEGKNGDVNLNLTGDISVEEIESALKNKEDKQ